MKNSRFPALLLAISLITTSLPAAFAAGESAGQSTDVYKRQAQRVSQIAFGLYGPFRSFSANPDSIGRLSGPHRGSAPLLQPGSASIGPAEQGPYFFPKDP